VAHSCNPSYSGGRDQEDHGSKPTQANCQPDPISKKTLHKKRASGVALGVGPKFKPQYCQKQNKNKDKDGWGVSQWYNTSLVCISPQYHIHTHTHTHTQKVSKNQDSE
jgi:hypothetical protein